MNRKDVKVEMRMRYGYNQVELYKQGFVEMRGIKLADMEESINSDDRCRERRWVIVEQKT